MMLRYAHLAPGHKLKAVEVFENAILAGRNVTDAKRWAFRVGQNAVLAAARRAKHLEGLATPDRERTPSPDGERSPETRSLAQLCGTLAACGLHLTRRQQEVVRKLDGQLSIRANAKALRMSPHNLRRMLATVKRHLKKNGALPPSLLREDQNAPTTESGASRSIPNRRVRSEG